MNRHLTSQPPGIVEILPLGMGESLVCIECLSSALDSLTGLTFTASLEVFGTTRVRGFLAGDGRKSNNTPSSSDISRRFRLFVALFDRRGDVAVPRTRLRSDVTANDNKLKTYHAYRCG